MLFNQRIGLIEPTEELKRVNVDTKTFTQPNAHLYTDTAYYISPTLANSPDGTYKAWFASIANDTSLRESLYKSVYNDSFPIYALCFYNLSTGSSSASWDEQPTTIKVESPSGVQTVITTNNQANTGAVLQTYNVNGNYGQWKVIYTDNNYTEDIPTATYTFSVPKNKIKKPRKTITEVINTVLNYACGNRNRHYVLDPARAEQWANITAPEFFFTRNTLYEVLLTIGSYDNIQAIPRLSWYEPTTTADGEAGLRLITFDDVDTTETWTPPGATSSAPYGNFVAYHVEQSAEEYFAGLDSYADNIIDNSVNGSIGLPVPTTPRCESGDLAITDNTVIIETAMPIYKIDKVELWVGDKVYDITPYIFEKSEYDLLTDYIGKYPTAKQYAFYYSQGAKNIYGLTLKPEVWDFLGINQQIQQTAAATIYTAVTGQAYANQGLANFMYRVQYTPIQSRRLKQYRPVVDERHDWNVSFYNQSANTLDAKNFGNNMKFMLAQKGNKLKVITYRLTGTSTGTIMSQVPKCGQLLNGDHICQVDVEYERLSVLCTVWAVENYNRKSQYVEINAQKRFYEVSERQSVLRQLNQSYEYRIGDKDPDATLQIVTQSALLALLQGTAPTDTSGRVACAKITMWSEDDGQGDQIASPLLLPVSAIGFGNSMSFHFEMADNYSAGNQAIEDDKSDAKYMLRAVPYGDEYGEFVSMSIQWGGNSFLGTATIARELPQADNVLVPVLFTNTINVAKDSREQISVDLQVHFRVKSDAYGNKPLVIGSALGERFPLVNAHTSDMDDAGLCWVALSSPLTPLQNIVTGSYLVLDEELFPRTFDTTTDPDGVYVSTIQVDSADTEAIALIVQSTGEILFGWNGKPEGIVQNGQIVYQYAFDQNLYFPTKVKPI